jgi:hypothetical protein
MFRLSFKLQKWTPFDEFKLENWTVSDIVVFVAAAAADLPGIGRVAWIPLGVS